MINIFDYVDKFFASLQDYNINYNICFITFISLFLLTIIGVIIGTSKSYESKLTKAIDSLNSYFLQNPSINEDNLVAFNDKLKSKKIPKQLRKNWQQYVLYRDGKASEYMSFENCVTKPMQNSSFKRCVSIMNVLAWIFSILSLLINFYVSYETDIVMVLSKVVVTPSIILVLNFIVTMFLNFRHNAIKSDLFQNYQYFEVNIDKATKTLPDYVDYEVLFDRAEIKRGIPILYTYLQKRAEEEQRELELARLKNVEHEKFNFEEAGVAGSLVLERAMQEAENYIAERKKYNQDTEQINSDITQEDLNFREITKEYNRQMQVSKETFANFKSQLEDASSSIEANYIKKQQQQELDRQRNLERDYDTATERHKKVIESLQAELDSVDKFRAQSRKSLEDAMMSEFDTYTTKVYDEAKKVVDEREKAKYEKVQKQIKELEEKLVSKNEELENLYSQNQILGEKLEKAKISIPTPVASYQPPVKEEPVFEEVPTEEFNLDEKFEENTFEEETFNEVQEEPKQEYEPLVYTESNLPQNLQTNVAEEKFEELPPESDSEENFNFEKNGEFTNEELSLDNFEEFEDQTQPEEFNFDEFDVDNENLDGQEESNNTEFNEEGENQDSYDNFDFDNFEDEYKGNQDSESVEENFEEFEDQTQPEEFNFDEFDANNENVDGTEEFDNSAEYNEEGENQDSYDNFDFDSFEAEYKENQDLESEEENFEEFNFDEVSDENLETANLEDEDSEEEPSEEGSEDEALEFDEFYEEEEDFDLEEEEEDEEAEEQELVEEPIISTNQNESEQSGVTKRKAGRPRKILTEEELNKPKRKPGRPRKEVSEEELNKPKRKPGRPRKIDDEESKTKKGPGRPRKDDSEESYKPKRKAGRPRKDSDKEEKRGPGRPKKEKVVKKSRKGPGRPKKSNQVANDEISRVANKKYASVASQDKFKNLDDIDEYLKEIEDVIAQENAKFEASKKQLEERANLKKKK